MSEQEKFREVEPLLATIHACANGPDLPDGQPTVYICEKQCNMEVARQIRDWLNKALPEEKP